jgi:succinyl-CoA synthetase beta subunit
MIAGGAQIDKEFYFSVLLDRANRSYLSLCSVEGGMEIEQLAVEKPEALAKVEVDPLTGIDEAKALEIAKAGGFDDETAAKVADVFVKLYNVYTGEDATLVEVNPLIQDASGNIIALDGKVTLDDNARGAPPRARGARRQGRRRPARGQGQGIRPQLRQARRPGRHHRQRRGPGHVDARRRRLRR